MYRRTKPSDLNAVLELNNEFLQYSIERQLDSTLATNNGLIEITREKLKQRILYPRKNPYTPVFVAEKDNKIIGYITGWVLDNKSGKAIINAVLENIFLTKDYRIGGMKYIKGTGTKLAKKFINLSKKRKSSKVIVEFYILDVEAEKFYTSKSMQFVKSEDSPSSFFKTKLEIKL